MPAGSAWFERVFAVAPGAMVLLDRELRVVAVNAAYLAATAHSREQLLGRLLFEPFPDNPDRPDLAGADAVRESILRARDGGQVDRLVARRYDIVAAGTDEFATRYWNLTTVPIRADDGRVELLLHRVQDVTASLASDAAEAAAVEANAELLEKLATAQADLLVRAEELQRLNDRLRQAGRHDRSVAQALQAAMLPTLPNLDGVQSAGRYLAAAVDDQVGGDWYDALASPGGSTTVVIGDVVGHDIAAAAIMGQVRSMLRAFAWEHQQTPAQIVSLLDRALRDLHRPTMATLTVLRVGPDPDPAAADGAMLLRWTVAGHPPGILLDADGSTTVLTPLVVDPPLGVAPDVDRHDTVQPLPVGGTVVLYTDGLIETRDDDLDHGMARLRAALSAHHTLPLEQMLDAVIADLVGEHPADDIAVIAVRAAVA